MYKALHQVWHELNKHGHAVLNLNNSFSYSFHSVPQSPTLSVQSVNGHSTIATQNVIFEWLFENNTDYVLSVTPITPQCSDPCVYRTDQPSQSIVLQVDILYNITARAEKCNGTLNSNDSKLIGFILQGC